MATNISFQILSLGNSAEQLHHWISQVLKLQSLDFWCDSPATAVPIQIVLTSQIHIQTNQENSRVNKDYGLDETSFAKMLVQDRTLPLVLESHTLDEGEAEKVHDTVSYELGCREVLRVVEDSEVQVLNFLGMGVVLVG